MKTIEELKNQIICADCLTFMKDIPDKSIDLIITSPPYNLGIDYDNYNDNQELNDYLLGQEKILRECFRILKDGGRLAWQVPSITQEKMYFPLNSWTSMKCLEIGFEQRAEIIWLKEQIPSRTAWGSFNSPSDNKILPSWEYIELFSKGNKKIQHEGTTDLDKNNFIEWTNGLWRIQPQTISVGHPAPFPIDLPKRIIQMNTYVGDIVLDCFLGSGTTAVACKQLNRNYIGIEISEKYCEIARQRLRQGILI